MDEDNAVPLHTFLDDIKSDEIQVLALELVVDYSKGLTSVDSLYASGQEAFDVEFYNLVESVNRAVKAINIIYKI
jgi:hypothetical protein